MRVPQRLDYALRALVLLALQPEGDYIAAGDLADHLSLPRRFVEQQVTALARAGIVRCRRGAAGGCALAREAREVTVLDVVEAVQGEVLDVPHVTGSAASTLWSDAEEHLSAFLATVTLADLAERQRELDGAAVSMYWI
jgi:Rrf2 family transcriptional regulator, iron-sulfur cluster assembly transcription factor